MVVAFMEARRDKRLCPKREVFAMIDWLLVATLLAIVALHWLFELLPGRDRSMWCSELSLEPLPAHRAPRRRRAR